MNIKLLSCLVILCSLATAIRQYEDEVGQKDWYAIYCFNLSDVVLRPHRLRKGFGKVEMVAMGQENSRPTHLFVATAEGVIAHLDFKSGDIRTTDSLHYHIQTVC
jgi:hypothetical protein